jgi:hypothetical protein
LDTKWKSRTKIFVWILLLTFGLSGIYSILDSGRWYTNKDYFQTEDFNRHLDEFIEYMSMAEINQITEEELKKDIKVTKQEIEDHRTHYGTLSEQVTNLKDQYQGKIEDAKAAGNTDVVKLYEQQRDEKIKDIMENFKSDEHVKRKIIKEKEKQIDAFLKARDRFIADYGSNYLGFQYYLEDTQTKEVFTNVKDANNTDDLSDNPTLFAKEYSSSENGYLHLRGPYTLLPYPQSQYPAQKPKTLQGIITLPKTASSGNWLSDQYYEFKKVQTAFYISSFISVLALCLALILTKIWYPIQMIAASNKRSIYNKIPIDVQLASYGISMIFMFIALIANSQNFTIPYSFYSISEWTLEFLLAILIVGITLVQGIWIFPNFSKRQLYKEALSVRMIRWFCRLGTDAFYNRSVGIQILLMLTVIFLSGFGAAVAYLEPNNSTLYVFLFIVVTIPVLLYLFKLIGYFNVIIKHSNEFAAGKLEQDLPHKGRSALAVLAGNLNLLKHGVKTSKKAEDKSERLKTELITNVSHDLRTPLTSIITYTELLKSQELTQQDHDAYLKLSIANQNV